MTKFKVPTPDKVSSKNQEIFENIKKNIGFVPNIYATYAYSDHALERFMTFAGGKTSLNNKEKEVVNLVVSQVNNCKYCLAAHTAGGKMNGFNDEQLLEIRKGRAAFDPKLNALAQLTLEIVKNRGNVSQEVLEGFFDSGFTKANLIDVIVSIGEKTTTNLLHKVTDVPLDFPEAPELEEQYTA